MGSEPDDLITQAEAARLRGVTRSAIGYLIAQNRLRTYERFGMRFVSRAEVDGFERLKPGRRRKSPSTGKSATVQKSTNGRGSTAGKKGGRK